MLASARANDQYFQSLTLAHPITFSKPVFRLQVHIQRIMPVKQALQ